MWTDEHYYQLPKYAVSGLVLQLHAWTFGFGALHVSGEGWQQISLYPLDITFVQDAQFDKQAALYIVPTVVSPDNYYLTEWSTDPALAQVENPPTVLWTGQVACIPCLRITIPKIGGGSSIIVTANEFDLPAPPDQRRDVKTKAGQVKAWKKGQQPEGWEELSVKKHKKAFPISLGKLKRGENWYILTPEAEEKLKKDESFNLQPKC